MSKGINPKENRGNEELGEITLALLKALTEITDNLENWLDGGEPANRKESERLYKNAKNAITKAIL